jgi:hypothetical protein
MKSICRKYLLAHSLILICAKVVSREEEMVTMCGTSICGTSIMLEIDRCCDI